MSTPYYSDPFATLYQGDCLEVMGQMEAESVDLCVTSPPYFGLRRYPDTERLWGGVEGCEHVWGQEQIVKRGHPGNLSTMQGTQTANLSKIAGNIGSFCALCGAWRGSYGNEPLADCGAWMRIVLTDEPMELCNTCYICHSVLILRAIRRVLRPWGSVFWVIDDSMAGSGSPGGDYRDGKGGDDYLRPYNRLAQGTIKAQDRMGIPERLSLALQADGWHWRSTIIWAKAMEIEQDGNWTGEGSTMPESLNGWRWVKHQVKVANRATSSRTGFRMQRPSETTESNYDYHKEVTWDDCPGCPKCTANGGYVLRKGNWRPTDSYERIIMLAKSLPYFGDSDAAAEIVSSATIKRSRYHWSKSDTKAAEYQTINGLNRDADYPFTGNRNPRSVWEINPEPTNLPHFAAFPSAIPRKIIVAMTSAKGNCPKCGMPWVPVVERTGHVNQREQAHMPNNEPTKTDSTGWAPLTQAMGQWLPSCRCGETQAGPAVVLDPFAGTGTTIQEAKKLGRRSIGIELSVKYSELASSRLRRVTMPMEGLL